MSDPGKLGMQPWVVVKPEGLAYIGLHEDEASAWTVYLGWPDAEDIAAAKAKGWYAAPATATWRAPGNEAERPTRAATKGDHDH